MSETVTCAQCDYVFPPGDDEPALAGLCPRCLAGGLGKTSLDVAVPPTTDNAAVRIDTIRTPLQPGSVFKGFEVLGILGQGGMGVVYKARQQSLNRLVALKLLNPELASSEEFAKRFDREAKVLASLSHPNVVHVHDFGKEDGLLYLVMEYVDGPTLEDVMKKKPADPTRFLTAVREVARGLQGIHEAGLVHRDIKPSNILMSKDGTAKISDFGLAIETEETQKLTQSGMFVGTPNYVSPEHVQGKKIDGRSDLYSLGVILFEGFAGRPPFQAPSATAILMKHVNEPAPGLHKVAPQSPRAAQEIVRKLLAKNPASRYDTAALLVRDLDRALEEVRNGPKPVPATARKVVAAAPPPSKLPMKWIAAAGAAALGAVVLLVAILSGKTEPKKVERPVVVERPAPRPQEVEQPREPEPTSVPVPAPAVVPVQDPPVPKPPEPKTPSAVEEAFNQGVKLFDQAKAAYEDGKARSSVDALTDASFKAEEAKAKFAAVQEIGGDDLKAKGVEQLKLVQQFLKLVHESRLAILNSKGVPPAPVPADPVPAVVSGVPAPVVAAPARPVRKEPLPEAAALKEAEKTIREIYKADYAKKAPADQQALAVKLLAQGRATNDDPRARYVLLREARDLSLQAGDLDTLLASIDEMGRSFEFDEIGARNASLTKIQVRTPEATGALTEALIDLARDAYDVDNYDVATAAATRADALPRSSADLALATRVADLRKELAAAKDEYVKVKGAIDKPGSGDQEALGRYYAFIKGDWERGLPILASSAKPPLNALAEKDLAVPQESIAQVETGDGWWDLVEKEKTPLRKSRLQDRAKYWYEIAYAGAQGLSKTKIEKRLEALDAANKGPVDLLKLIDPRADAINGNWSLEKGSLVSAKEWYGRIQVRYVPPEEYDLRFVVERRDHDEDLIVGLTKGDAQLTANLDSGHCTYSSFGDQATRADQSPKYSGKLFTQGRLAILLCSVRKKSVTVTVDGKKILTYAWKGDEARSLIANQWEIPNRKILFVGAHGTAFAIRSMMLIPVTGAGHVDRGSGGFAPPAASAGKKAASGVTLPKGPIDLLAMVDPLQDAVDGSWSLENQALVSVGGPHVRLQLPVQAPDEYDLKVVVTRVEGEDGIVFGLVQGAAQWTVFVDKIPQEGFHSGLEMLDNGMSTLVKGQQLVNNRPTTFEFKVRKSGFSALKDGKPFLQWQGNYNRLSNFPKWQVRDPKALFVGQWESRLRYTEIRLTPVSGDGRLLRAAVLAAAPVPKGAVDLLSLIDPSKDAVKGDWTLEGQGLNCPSGEHVRLQIPYSPPDEYDLILNVTRKEGADGLLVGLVKGSAQWAVTLDTQASGQFKTGFESIDNRGPSDNPSTYTGPVFSNGVETTLEFQVRKAGVTVIAGGKKIVNWKGSFNQLSLPDGWKVKSPNALFLAAWTCRYQFSRILLVPVSGQGTMLRKPAAVPAPAGALKGSIDLLLLVDPKRDAVSGTWAKQGGAVISDAKPFSRLEILYQPPAEYDLRTTFSRVSGNLDINQIFMASGKQIIWSMGAGNGASSGFATVRGQWADGGDNPTRGPSPKISVGESHTTVLQVRKNGIKVFFDGQLIREWAPDWSEVTSSGAWALKHSNALGLATYESAVSFQKVELVEVTGTGMRIR